MLTLQHNPPACVRSTDDEKLSNVELILQRAEELQASRPPVVAVTDSPPPTPVCLSTTLKAERAVESWTPGRGDQKLFLMEQDPHCTGCRERLTRGRNGNNNCNLAANHLFCNWCIRLVRQKSRDVQLKIIAVMKRKLAERDAREAELKTETRPAVLSVPICAEVPTTDMDAVDGNHRQILVSTANGEYSRWLPNPR